MIRPSNCWLVVASQPDFERWRELEKLAVQKPCCYHVAARNLLYETFCQALTLIRLDGSNEPCAFERRNVVVDAATVSFHQGFGRGLTGVVAKKQLDRVDESRFSVSASAVHKKQNLFTGITSEGIPYGTP